MLKDKLFDLAKDFEKNMNLIFTAVTIPALISVGSVFLLGTGLGWTIVFNMTGLAGGVVSAMLPALREKSQPQ